MLSSYKTLLLVGLGGLLHAGYTATQYRAFIRITSQEFTGLPADIVVYTLLCLAVTCYALIQVVCTFREIRTYEQSAHLSWDSLFHRQSLIGFNHRAKALSGYLAARQTTGVSDSNLLPASAEQFEEQENAVDAQDSGSNCSNSQSEIDEEESR